MSNEQTPTDATPPMQWEDPSLVGTTYIDNAGLVLLHPFIPTYFSRLGMTENGIFVNHESQLRAAQLLQYVVFENEGSHEPKLALNKLLAGLPIDALLPVNFEITDNEKEMSDQLLKAVARNWEKLTDTSINGLRVSFLQRGGILTKGNEEWALTLDERGYDILLQTLPWGISMIKTPWMQQPLYVKWI